MKSKRLFRRLALAAGLIFALAGQGAGAEDAGLARKLTQAGYGFKVDGDGDYLIVIEYAAERRSQQVFVSGRTVAVNGIPTRKIFAPASVGSKDPVTGAKALDLLGANYRHGIGAWELNGGVLFLAIKVPDSLGPAELRAAIRAAAELADDMEKSISGARDEL